MSNETQMFRINPENRASEKNQEGGIMATRNPSLRQYELYGILWVARQSEAQIIEFLSHECRVATKAIQHGLHLTVYYSRRPVPRLNEHRQSVSIVADVSETRFMVLAPGGENPRIGLEPSRRSIGIRLTKRNQAIGQILNLRRGIYQLEPSEWSANRKPTSDWQNAFGARHYQPHIKLLQPGNEVDRDLTEIGKGFRSSISYIEFDRFEVIVRAGTARRGLI